MNPDPQHWPSAYITFLKIVFVYLHAVPFLQIVKMTIVTVFQAKDAIITSKQPAAVLGDGSRCQSPVVSSSTPPLPLPTAPTPQRNKVWKSVVGALLEAQKSNPSIAQNQQQQQHEFLSSSRDLATLRSISHAPVDAMTSVDEASVSSSNLPHTAVKSSVGAGASFPVPSARKIRPLTGDKNHIAAAFPGIQPVVKGVDSAIPAAPGASSERQKQMKDLPPGSEVSAVSVEPAESEISSQVTCQAIKSIVNMTPCGKPNQGVMTPIRKPGLVSMTPRSMTLTPMAMSMTPSGKPTFASSPMQPRTPRGSQVRFFIVLRFRDPVPF
jgi:hypothetical protein